MFRSLMCLTHVLFLNRCARPRIVLGICLTLTRTCTEGLTRPDRMVCAPRYQRPLQRGDRAGLDATEAGGSPA